MLKSASNIHFRVPVSRVLLAELLDPEPEKSEDLSKAFTNSSTDPSSLKKGLHCRHKLSIRITY